MENAIGIEAARARLGDIAEHARTTGQVTALTRHGRTIAAIGPANKVRQRAAFALSLHFPTEDWEIEAPAVPRKGDAFEWTDENGVDSFWIVTDVTWSASRDGMSIIGIDLDPAAEEIKERA
jgi:antitoxin (DNA-binding transcriptional repressor) of toxin-antitoxin stability system